MYSERSINEKVFLLDTSVFSLACCFTLRTYEQLCVRTYGSLAHKSNNKSGIVGVMRSALNLLGQKVWRPALGRALKRPALDRAQGPVARWGLGMWQPALGCAMRPLAHWGLKVQ